jgi:hypothetical protein
MIPERLRTGKSLAGMYLGLPVESTSQGSPNFDGAVTCKLGYGAMVRATPRVDDRIEFGNALRSVRGSEA